MNFLIVSRTLFAVKPFPAHCIAQTVLPISFSLGLTIVEHWGHLEAGRVTPTFSLVHPVPNSFSKRGSDIGYILLWIPPEKPNVGFGFHQLTCACELFVFRCQPRGKPALQLFLIFEFPLSSLIGFLAYLSLWQTINSTKFSLFEIQ